ncbi:MAG: sulfotransferase [Caulobacteraceae bacterium]|nr:sulfotransferase [Caulobacteraceae bacterium]
MAQGSIETQAAASTGRLDAAALMAAAERATGLKDYGDPTLAARVEAMCAAMNRAALDKAGRGRAESVFLWLLSDRLRLFDDHKRFGVGREAVERPIIVTGEARCGTTFAQMLLGQDPASRLLQFWEVMHPSPPPSLAAPDDPRRIQADADWREILDQIPAWLVSHPYNDMLGRNPPECERTWAMDFRNTTPTGWWRVPLAPIAPSPQDPAAQYRLHKMMLQQLQYGGPKRRWALKGLQHHHRLETVLATYPDAVIVWIHRDPVQALASRVQLLTEIFEGIAGPIDRHAFAQATLAYGRDIFARLAVSETADDPRVHHVLYPEFTHDPIGQIERIYQRAGLPFTEASRQAMLDWAPANRSDRYGKFRYPLEVFGTPTAQLHEEFEPYRARFGVEIERPKT